MPRCPSLAWLLRMHCSCCAASPLTCVSASSKLAPAAGLEALAGQRAGCIAPHGLPCQGARCAPGPPLVPRHGCAGGRPCWAQREHQPSAVLAAPCSRPPRLASRSTHLAGAVPGAAVAGGSPCRTSSCPSWSPSHPRSEAWACPAACAAASPLSQFASTGTWPSNRLSAGWRALRGRCTGQAGPSRPAAAPAWWIVQPAAAATRCRAAASKSFRSCRSAGVMALHPASSQPRRAGPGWALLWRRAHPTMSSCMRRVPWARGSWICVVPEAKPCSAPSCRARRTLTRYAAWRRRESVPCGSTADACAAAVCAHSRGSARPRPRLPGTLQAARLTSRLGAAGLQRCAAWAAHPAAWSSASWASSCRQLAGRPSC